MLRGIDVSGYQALGATYSHPNVETAYSGSDFVIAKATQGTQPMNRYMTAQLQRALADGKLIGVYHYAEGGSPVAEADAFVACVSSYIGKALLCLDWENGDNDAWGSTVWARQFVDRVYAKTGIYPVVYTYPAGRAQVASCADVSRLWIAGYPDNRFSWDLPTMIYNTGAWSDWTLWQYSSAGGTVDLDVAKLTYAEWEQLAQGESKFEPHWVKNATGWWYATSPSAYYYSQWAFINGSWYYFDARGYAVTGWYFDGTDWFYLCPDEGPQECAMLTGMQHIGSYNYYFANDGRMATGIFDAEGKKYLASENGNLLPAGVHVHNDHAYAVNADGSVQADSTVQVDTDEVGRLTSLH
jgi:putative lysozyme|nr:MAG TPA: LysA like endolysin [Caudoviricetes sp.]